MEGMLLLGLHSTFLTSHKRIFGGGMAIKINIRKAFDTIRWDFVRAILHCFGFSGQFMSWISMIF